MIRSKLLRFDLWQIFKMNTTLYVVPVIHAPYFKDLRRRFVDGAGIYRRLRHAPTLAFRGSANRHRLPHRHT
jgi:hypothetical protein